MDHRNKDERLAGFTKAFIIFGETAATAQPGESSFDYPTLGQHSESSAGQLGHNLQMNPAPAASLTQAPKPLVQFATIAAVGPDLSQSPMMVVFEWHEQFLGSISILGVRRLNLGLQHQTERIYEYMSLSATHFLARIIAPRPPFSVVLTLWLSIIAALASG